MKDAWEGYGFQKCPIPLELGLILFARTMSIVKNAFETFYAPNRFVNKDNRVPDTSPHVICDCRGCVKPPTGKHPTFCFVSLQQLFIGSAGIAL